MVGAPDVVQPWMPRAARDSDACLWHVSVVGGTRRRGCAAAGVPEFFNGPSSRRSTRLRQAAELRERVDGPLRRRALLQQAQRHERQQVLQQLRILRRGGDRVEEARRRLGAATRAAGSGVWARGGSARHSGGSFLHPGPSSIPRASDGTPSWPHMQVRPAEPGDTDAVAAIYNHGIAERQATFETRARRPQEVAAWLEEGRPFLVAVDDDGTGLGVARAPPPSAPR